MIGVAYFEKEKYFAGLKPHIEIIDKVFPNNDVVAVCLQGSQNYGLDTKDSDFDSRALVLPNINNIAFNAKNLSGTKVIDNGEHLSYKDMRDYLNELRKQSISSIELLFSSAYVYNSLYEKEWKMLIDNRERIARMNPHRLVRSAIGMARSHYAKYRVEGKMKTLYHLVRLSDLVTRYVGEEPYKDILKPSDADFILSIKNGEVKKEECDNIAEDKMKYLEAVSKSYLRDMVDRNDEDTMKILEEAQKAFIEKALYYELEGRFF